MQHPWPYSRCAACRHQQLTGNDRGSVFLLCRKSKEDARFAKYPPQPVRACTGFAPQQDQ